MDRPTFRQIAEGIMQEYYDGKREVKGPFRSRQTNAIIESLDMLIDSLIEEIEARKNA